MKWVPCFVDGYIHVWSSKQYQLFIMLHSLHSHENKETLLNMNPLPACAAWIKQCKAVNSIHWRVSPCIHHPPMTSPVLLRSQWCPGDTKRTRKKCIAIPPKKEIEQWMPAEEVAIKWLFSSSLWRGFPLWIKWQNMKLESAVALGSGNSRLSNHLPNHPISQTAKLC